jgi:hypothetical protein
MISKPAFLQGIHPFDGSTLELHLAAREGVAGTVVVDLGTVEV